MKNFNMKDEILFFASHAMLSCGLFLLLWLIGPEVNPLITMTFAALMAAAVMLWVDGNQRPDGGARRRPFVVCTIRLSPALARVAVPTMRAMAMEPQAQLVWA